MIYTYFDSAAGMQTWKFENLSELIGHIESFENPKEDSGGRIYQDGEPILDYESMVGHQLRFMKVN